MSLVSRENVLESYKLAKDAAWWRACSGASHWPVGCASVTGQGEFEYAGTMRDE